MGEESTWTEIVETFSKIFMGIASSSFSELHNGSEYRMKLQRINHMYFNTLIAE